MEIYYEVLRSYRDIRKRDNQYDFGTLVIDKLTADAGAVFTALPIPVTGGTSLTSINNLYLTKINAAKGGDHTAVDDRDIYRDKTWMPAFDKTADYVEKVAGGDINIINLSGFKHSKGIREAATLPKKMHLELNSPMPGVMTFKSDTKAVGQGARYVLIGGTRPAVSFSQHADGKVIIETTGPAKIIVAPVRTKKGTLKGLPSEEKMNAVIFGINAAGAGPLSQEAKIIIQ